MLKENVAKIKMKVLKVAPKVMTVVGTLGTTIIATVSPVSCTAGSATSGVADAVTTFSQIWTMITGNPVLTLFIGVSVLGAGIGLFAKLFRTVRH